MEKSNMKIATLLQALTIGATLGLSHIAIADGNSDAAQSKSGAGPGSTGNSDATPSPTPAVATSASAPATSGTDAITSGTDTSTTQAPTVGDPGAGKSGLAPGSNGNPVGTGTSADK